MDCIICTNKGTGTILEDFLQKYGSLTNMGTFTDSESIMENLAKRNDVDIVFLETEITGIDIFSFLETLDFSPNLILISVDDTAAFKAFEFNVVDYLIQPLSYGRFCKAIEKAKKYYVPAKETRKVEDEVFIKKGPSLVKIKFNDIRYVEALENYVSLFTLTDKYTIHFTMKAFESQIATDFLIRIHRSFIVNRNYIKSIDESSVELADGDRQKYLPIGKSYRGQLLEKINVINRDQ